jgi:hypothetical protein
MLRIQIKFKGVVFVSQKYNAEEFKEIFKQINHEEEIWSFTETKKWQ